MAALSDLHTGRVVELRRIAAEELEPVLEEEVVSWRRELDWDLRSSTKLVHRFVQMQSLNGFALIRANRVIGFSYYVCEDSKGLIGDLYVIDAERTIEHENALIGSVLSAMWATPGVRRAEAQLMMLRLPLDRPVPQPDRFRRFPRIFMEIPSAALPKLSERTVGRVSIVPWTEARQDATARLMAASYRGHIDSEINDQYRSPGGARRFLANIIQYPGCGTFFGRGSFAAVDSSDGSLSGVCLASLVAEDVGHITQVCVSPHHRGTGLGYELLRRSLLALGAHGCRSISLTVTSSNDTAIALYNRMGFSTRRQFAAYTWELR